ncbi:MAG: DUF4190 domain-containing protein [Bacteroidetes bacterium]|nr:DUF4190 domain-containing protein [Bacteroidota bacterium]
MIRNLLLFLTLILAISSCTIQKRRYNRGFYLEGFTRNGAKNHAEKLNFKPLLKASKDLVNNDSLQFTLQRLKHAGLPPIEEFKKTQIAGSELNEHAKNKNTEKFFNDLNRVENNADPEKCDHIIFSNGDEAEVLITDITTDSIFYTPCDQPDGEIIGQSVKSVFMVKRADGSKQTFDNTQHEVPESHPSKSLQNEDRTIPASAIVSLISGIMIYLTAAVGIAGVGLILIVLAMVTGIVALSKIKSNPNEYRGSAMAITGIVLASLALLLTVFALLILLAFFGSL